MFSINLLEHAGLTLAILIPFLITVAFFTLAERKLMAAIQRRRGPNMVGIGGVLQPIADGAKLLLKEVLVPYRSNYYLFLFAPVMALTLSFTLQAFLPYTAQTIYADVNLGIFALFAFSSLNAYSVIIAGWASNSKYAFLGSLRAVAQLISYELVIGFILIILILLTGSARLLDFVLFQIEACWFIIPLFPVGVIFFIALLAETNRTPFDLPEAESELVAGYNVEYSSITFAMFFLAEYCNMIIMSFIITLLFFGGWDFPVFSSFIPQSIFYLVKVLFFCFLFVLVRSSVPRYRFDQLMDICWNTFLPVLFGFFWLVCTWSLEFALTPISYEILPSSEVITDKAQSTFFYFQSILGIYYFVTTDGGSFIDNFSQGFLIYILNIEFGQSCSRLILLASWLGLSYFFFRTKIPKLSYNLLSNWTNKRKSTFTVTSL